MQSADDAFDVVEREFRSGGPEAGLDFLARKFLEEKDYPRLFEVRFMRKRREMAQDQAVTEVAREVGLLYLSDGNIQRAWPYFRAIGEPGLVAAAIEKLDASGDQVDGVLQIALDERVHPRKGFELLLARYGICRAITFFEQYPDPETREECAILLVGGLHRELVESLRRAIEQREGAAPDGDSVPALISGRDWLFGDLDAYVDTSHVISVIRFALDLKDAAALRLALELCSYGSHLSPQFKYRVDPPFDDVYVDHALYLRALVGDGVDDSIEHFRKKISPDDVNAAPAQVLVALLARLERYRDAIQVSVDHLSQLGPDQLVCPPVLQLCQMAGDYALMQKLARERGDLIGFATAVIS
jgi:hypothetical protein